MSAPINVKWNDRPIDTLYCSHQYSDGKYKNMKSWNNFKYPPYPESWKNKNEKNISFQNIILVGSFIDELEIKV